MGIKSFQKRHGWQLSGRKIKNKQTKEVMQNVTTKDMKLLLAQRELHKLPSIADRVLFLLLKGKIMP